MPSRHKRSPLTFRLPEAEREQLEAHAKAHGLKVGTVIAQAVRELLGREGAPQRETGWCATCHRTVYLDDPAHGTGCTEDHDPGCGCGL